MAFDMRVIGGAAVGIVVGVFLSEFLRGEDSGDRIVAAARNDQSLAVMFIGTNGTVRALDLEKGNPINDCKTGTCKTDVVLSPFGEPVLINKATGRPVEPAKIINEEKVYQWNFELSPGCTRIWPAGEICKPR